MAPQVLMDNAASSLSASDAKSGSANDAITLPKVGLFEAGGTLAQIKRFFLGRVNAT